MQLCIHHMVNVTLTSMCGLTSAAVWRSPVVKLISCSEVIRSRSHGWSCNMWLTVCPECVVIAALHVNKHTDDGGDVCVFVDLLQQDWRTCKTSVATFPLSFCSHSPLCPSVCSAAVCPMLLGFCVWLFLFCSVYFNSFFLLLIHTCYLLIPQCKSETSVCLRNVGLLR